jgi:predicted PurR-regulated permease PerM
MARRDYSRIAALLLLAVVLYYVYRILQPVLPALAWGAILATLFQPLFVRLARRLRRPRLASALSCVLLIVGIVLPAIFLLSMLAGQSVVAYKALEARLAPSSPGFADAIQRSHAYQWGVAKSRRLGVPEPDLKAAAIKAVGLVSGFLVSRSAAIFSGVTSLLLNFLVTVLLFYYLLLRGPDILRQLQQASPLRPEHHAIIMKKSRLFARAIFGGILATALAHGVAGGLIFLFAGLPSPLLWGAVLALVSLLPLVGTAVVWVPLVIHYLLTGAVWKGIILAAAFIGASVLADYVVRPRVMGQGLEIDDVWILLSVIGGIAYFGFLGLFLGPILLTLLWVLLEIYKDEFREELSGDTTS